MDELSEALAEAIEAIDHYSAEERYSEPALAAWIASVRAAMEDLQLFLDDVEGAPDTMGDLQMLLDDVEGAPDKEAPQAHTPREPNVAAFAVSNDGKPATPGRVERIPTLRPPTRDRK